MRKSSIDKRLRILLADLGYTQKEFSKVTGITESSICRYLDGTRVPNVETVVRITDLTNVDPSWLLGYGDDDKMERM